MIDHLYVLLLLPLNICLGMGLFWKHNQIREYRPADPSPRSYSIIPNSNFGRRNGGWMRGGGRRRHTHLDAAIEASIPPVLVAVEGRTHSRVQLLLPHAAKASISTVLK
jgi:hypothetical protein